MSGNQGRVDTTTDFIVIGGGVVGLAIARELKLRHPDLDVTVLEKERETGLHASGRNSGVLHTGIYYLPDSLKAKVCRQGALEMAAYHEEHNLPLDRRGKLLVVTNEADAQQLDVLEARALSNGIQVERIDAQQLRELEPEARSVTGEALWVPETSVGSPVAMMWVLRNEVEQLGVRLLCNIKISKVSVKTKTLFTQDGMVFSYGHAINAAGLHADQVAQEFNCGLKYALLPFKGIYWKLDPLSGIKINHLIYPVPDLRVPFLGVHTTTTTDGATYLGPTAVPAFGRENYHGLKGVNWPDFRGITGMLAHQYLSGKDGFRRLAWQEGRRYFKPWFTDAAQSILPRLRPEHLLASEKVGIRPQMLDRQTGRLVNDFLVEKGIASTHVLNAISPAWTSAFPFARYICDHFVEARN